MILLCNDCKGNRALLADMAKQPRIDTWFDAIISRETIFKPIECSFYGPDETEYKVIHSNKVLDTEEIRRIISRLPEELIFMPNDYIEIEANEFEKELKVYLYGRLN